MPISSFSKRTWVVIVLKIVVFLLLTGLMIFGLSRLVVVKESAVAQYLSGGAASDVIFLGTSSVRRISPKLVDEASGLDTYNLATNAQSLVFTRALLKECIARGVKPAIVVLNLQERGIDRDPSASDNIILRELTGFRKLQMLKVMDYKLDDYPEALLPCAYYRHRLFDMIDRLFGESGSEKTYLDDEDSSSESDQSLRSGGVSAGVSHSDQEGNEPNAADPDSVEARLERDAQIAESYFGKGFSENETEYMDPKELDIGAKGVFVASDIKADHLEYILDIIRICRENDIDIVFYSIPAMPAYVLSLGGEGHGSFHDYFTELAEQYAVPYWDLNYIRPEILEIDSTMFSSSRHGNATYSLRISPLIGRMLRDYMDGTLDPNRYLFDDYETYSLLHPGIYRLNATGINTTKSDEQYIVVSAVSDEKSPLEYRVTWLKDDGEEVLLSPWKKNDHIIIGTDLSPGKYVLRIETRRVGNEEAEGSIVRTLSLSG